MLEVSRTACVDQPQTEQIAKHVVADAAETHKTAKIDHCERTMLFGDGAEIDFRGACRC